MYKGIHSSRMSHWPKVLGLEQMMDNMKIYKNNRGIQETSTNGGMISVEFYEILLLQD
jgi:hypothetical protein